jgi:hypothetical protein
MNTQITRYLGTLALAALLTTSTAAFAATPASTSPALYDASEEGGDVAGGLTVGGATLGIGSAIVGAAGGTEAGQDVAGGLQIGDALLTNVAAPIVVLGTH